MDTNRANRFVSDQDSCELFKSQSLNNLKPYYGGQLVTSRMAEVRKSIVYIRENWESRAEFAENLTEFLKDKLQDSSDSKFIERVESLKKHQRNWGDIDETQLKGEFEVIRLYTSKLGYDRIFSALNSLFRCDQTTSDDKTIQTIVFLIEMINIDLYNFCLKFPTFDNFTGIVYRGVGLNQSDFDAFKMLMKQDISKRYIAIPLGLMSSTTNIDAAKDFIKKTKHADAVLFKVHILELKPVFLKYYKEQNPTGAVSTICAVNIERLSDFPEEEEVILRGAFFQVLDFFKDKSENVDVLEVCMLNTNRDHISNIHLTDPNARKMFGLMISVTRNEFAVNFYKSRGNSEEAAAYQVVLKQAKKDLSLLIPEDLVDTA